MSFANVRSPGLNWILAYSNWMPSCSKYSRRYCSVWLRQFLLDFRMATRWLPLAYFQPGVDVVFEESFTRLVKMPDLIDVLDFVPQVHRFR